MIGSSGTELQAMPAKPSVNNRLHTLELAAQHATGGIECSQPCAVKEVKPLSFLDVRRHHTAELHLTACTSGRGHVD